MTNPSETKLVEMPPDPWINPAFPRTSAIFAAYYEKEGRNAEDEERDLWEPVSQLERELAEAKADLADEAPARFQLQDALERAQEKWQRAESALASLADELRLARVLARQWEVKALSAEQAINKAQERVAELEKALKEAAGMLQASLPYWQTDERGNGPDCTPLLQAILNANAALKEPR